VHKVRTTIEPGRVIEVDDRELADLKFNNLVAEVVGDDSQARYTPVSRDSESGRKADKE
jgi:hypothetical protein